MSADKERTQRLVQYLLGNGKCSAADLARAEAVVRQEGGRLDRVLLRLGLAEENVLCEALCELFVIERLNLINATPDSQIITNLTHSFLNRRLLVPLLADGVETAVPVAMVDPLDTELIAELQFHLERTVTPIAATTAELRALLSKSAEPAENSGTNAKRDAESMRRAEQDGPVIRFVQDMLSDAVINSASDVHVELADDVLHLRFRVNGVLVAQPVQPALNPASVIARLKVMAGMNVAERRLPQDGRLQAIIAGRKIDFRISSLPTHIGESVVARVLDPKALRLGWSELGFSVDVIEWIRATLAKPHGLFLVTGPTGSGKTTTLYTALAHLNVPSSKIITVEDPVEYHLPGIQQVQVQDEIGLTFPRVLRGVLRHDPNVIMVGEIRDGETAEIAVRAAQVGRLVLSTLHTNSPTEAMNRLTNLGVPRYLIRDVLRGALGQELRLVTCNICNGRGCFTCSETGVTRRELATSIFCPPDEHR